MTKYATNADSRLKTAYCRLQLVDCKKKKERKESWPICLQRNIKKTYQGPTAMWLTRSCSLVLALALISLCCFAWWADIREVFILSSPSCFSLLISSCFSIFSFETLFSHQNLSSVHLSNLLSKKGMVLNREHFIYSFV